MDDRNFNVSPEVLCAYERVLPGSADRIVAIADKQAAHRRKMEAVAERQSKLELRMIWLIAAIGIAAGSYVAYLGQTAWAAAVFAVSFGSVAASYLANVYNHRH